MSSGYQPVGPKHPSQTPTPPRSGTGAQPPALSDAVATRIQKLERTIAVQRERIANIESALLERGILVSKHVAPPDDGGS